MSDDGVAVQDRTDYVQAMAVVTLHRTHACVLALLWSCSYPALLAPLRSGGSKLRTQGKNSVSTPQEGKRGYHDTSQPPGMILGWLLSRMM